MGRALVALGFFKQIQVYISIEDLKTPFNTAEESICSSWLQSDQRTRYRDEIEITVFEKVWGLLNPNRKNRQIVFGEETIDMRKAQKKEFYNRGVILKNCIINGHICNLIFVFAPVSNSKFQFDVKKLSVNGPNSMAKTYDETFRGITDATRYYDEHLARTKEAIKAFFGIMRAEGKKKAILTTIGGGVYFDTTQFLNKQQEFKKNFQSTVQSVVDEMNMNSSDYLEYVRVQDPKK